MRLTKSEQEIINKMLNSIDSDDLKWTRLNNCEKCGQELKE